MGVGVVLGVGGLCGFLLLDRLFPFPFERLVRPAAIRVQARDATTLRIFLPVDGILRLPVRLEDVSPSMRTALIASEDRWLGVHPGVNPLAVLRALASNARAGRIVSGASTIPMQVARLVERRPRTLVSKAIESFRALQLCWHLEAERILEAYLNLAPFGGNLEGIGAAADSWFGKRPDELSLGEAALLTALPRAPRAYDPARHPEAARRARDGVLRRLGERGVFPRAALREARRQPLPTARRALPLRAPHFARWARAGAPEQHRIVTTLDPHTQQVAEALVRSRVHELRQRGIGNAAVVVIETGPRLLCAMVGSAGFFEAERPGQVNGATARRSPGSALKPFLYALAFDDGRLVPDSWLLDLPFDFSGYVAENYDGRYRGRVTATEALVASLNAPAVRLLADLGLARFLEQLRRAGVASLDRPASSYGLPLVLGGGELTLLELTNLYATLAAGGRHRRLAWREDSSPDGERIFSEEAAALTTRILGRLRRPDLPRAWQLAREVPAVAWKTGTSYGHRDAWAIGFASRLTVGVWVGNLDGRGRPGLSGSQDAAPLLFDLLRALDPGSEETPRPRPPRLHSTEVCALSHERPGPFCPERVHVAAIRGVSRLPVCRVHRRVFLDAASGLRLVGRCLGSRPHRSTVVEVFAPELVAWWRSEGRVLAGLPALHPACRVVPGESPPRIVSPEASTPYRLRADAPRAFQKVQLAARTDAGTRRLYWYQDGRLVASASPADPVFARLEPGAHRLVVVDDAGRSHSIRYRVE